MFYTFECFKNGNEYTIIVKPKRDDQIYEESDDEKIPQ